MSFQTDNNAKELPIIHNKVGASIVVTPFLKTTTRSLLLLYEKAAIEIIFNSISSKFGMKWMSLHLAAREITGGNTLIKERRSASDSSRLSWQQLKLLYILYIGHAGKNKPVFIHLPPQITWYSGPYHNEHKGRAEFALSTLQAEQASDAASPFCSLLTSPTNKTLVYRFERLLQAGT